MRSVSLWRSVLLSMLFVIPTFALAQSPGNVAGQFVVTKSPVRDGVRATADLPESQHHRNTGGLGRGGPGTGDGLCVYTSFWHAAIWQAAAEVYGFRDWMKSKPGGSYPEKFEATLSAYCKERGIPCPGYVQHTGGDEEFLELALKTGRMVCVTYCGVDGPGRYGNEVIGHMVNLVYLDKERACILDNNFPGTFLWMSRVDFLARWRGIQTNGKAFLIRDNFGRWMPVGGGWAIILLASPPTPYPESPAVQFGAEQSTCICGDNCQCKRGDCPAKCPLSIQQCPGGRCPLPGMSPAWSSEGKWVPSEGGKEWGYWVNGRRVAAAFSDGRVEATDANGLANGVRILPPAQLPAGLVTDVPQPMPATATPPATGDVFPHGGVMPDRLTSGTRYWCNGSPCTKQEAHAALALTDDSERWNLAIVGEPGFARKVRDDVSLLPAAVRSKLHVQSYAPSDWPVAQFKLPVGVTLRKPAVGRVGADLGVVPVADYTSAALAELLAVAGGPNPKPAPAPTPKPKDDPVLVPVQPKPAPIEPTPAPQPVSPKPDHTWIVLLIGGAVIVWLMKGR